MQAAAREELRIDSPYPAALLVSYAVPLVCFVGALVTDVAYERTSEIQWANFSAWLLAIGTALGALCFLYQLVRLFRAPRWLGGRRGWLSAGLMVIALAIALANNFIHARDGWTSVVPSGLILSAITVALLIAATVLRARSPIHDRIGDAR
jgi:uncharacterized membrane protein